MAKESNRDRGKTFDDIIREISAGEIAPLYVLMGEEPYYSDIITEKIAAKALAPHERDFNLLTMYGPETDAVRITEAARRYPMMAARQVVIVKEAQLLDHIDDLIHYFSNPFPSTVLVISLTGKSLDKRGSLYKTALKNATVLESSALREYQLTPWIEDYVNKRGRSIDRQASELLAEHCGTELRKVAKELDKLITHIGSNERITITDVEENTGISREFNTFELAKAVSARDTYKAVRIATHFGKHSKQYPNVLTFAALFYQFSKLLKYHAYIKSGKSTSSPYFLKATGAWPSEAKELERSAQIYPLPGCIEVISLIRRYDSMSKSGSRGEAEDGELLTELICKIMHQGTTIRATLG
ncbi:MAG: DNA polymerase III subunit delta [Bacteroidales bacterium]|nr:DNA polymerase III subunit delta [Bacteroidales bacterium]MDD2424834.1 DNA polymerase III subunit delta [Bacteroidales bacterium]MDD3989982.1 DNA polymerase III subunit delta [Bacteroidales bacterium]MDD4639056.1 DNA polymerase III subunit delta [Bacteroidales bacterium]